MKTTVDQLLSQAINALKNEGVIPQDVNPAIKVERTKDKTHGDFATNVALMLAKPCRMSPKDLAGKIADVLPEHALLEKIEIAGPGFINFFMTAENKTKVIADILQLKEQFGQRAFGNHRPLILEYVSANPTGPLHVGHGRSAAFGATLASLLKTAGYNVSREYYVNDAGRQMDILAVSVWLRYLECAGQPVVFPSNGYRGAYIRDIAQKLFQAHDMDYVHDWFVLIEPLPADEPSGGDKEQYIDAMINAARKLLGVSGFELFHSAALNEVLEDIKNDLADFGVEYDEWFSERSLKDDGSIEKGIEALKQAGHTFEQTGALWFKATDFGDDKDRVLIRANGQPTYFASDVAYHWNKYNRGFEKVIDIFGADHHGYVTRVRSAVKALGHDETALDVLLVQFAILYRDGNRIQMSTRSGSFVTLRELRDEVGKDAARFFYVMRKPEQHMDFDLDLAKSQSNDNPVYYIQYAHARICSVFRQLEEKDMGFAESDGLANLSKLTESHELDLISIMSKYPEVIESAAKSCEPHQLAYYLRELATSLHSYYNAVPLLCEDTDIRSARLCLIKAVGQVLKNCLTILGVSAPRKM